MATSRAVEIEIKAHVRNPGQVSDYLQSNAKFVRKYYKKDMYFRRSSDDTIDSLVRIRQDRGGHIFTVKQRAMLNGVEVNDEREMKVHKKDARKYLTMLTTLLGYEPYVTKIKKGRAYRYQNTLIELSEVKGLGWFVEIEIIADEKPDDSTILKLRAILGELGIPETDIETRPYTALLREH
ncbi:MAG: class IV adenylate cyclase [Spirochaetes bacterium]|nr:class IV adenylate cyclase [Spirochaetota bacterium]